MREIIFNDNNEERLRRELTGAQKCARTRKIMIEDIRGAIKEIENKYSLVSDTVLEDCTFWCNPHAQRFANAYRGVPESTQFKLRRKYHSWRIVEIRRCRCTGIRIKADLTRYAKERIIEMYERF